jgi:DNA repair protein RecO (recombination protein O)
MLEKTQGIVLHTVPYSESSLIAHIFTKKYGMQSYLVNGVRKPKPRFSISLFQPLTQVELVMYRKQTPALKRFREIQHAGHYRSITSNPVKNSIAIFIAEVLYRTLHDSDAQQELYEFTAQSLNYFDLMPQGFSSFHHFYLIRLMRYLGFYPEASAYRSGYVFNLATGSYHPANETALHCTDSETASLLYNLQQSDIENFDMVMMTAFQKKTLLNALVEYYSHHLPKPVHIRSHEVLQEVFEG